MSKNDSEQISSGLRESGTPDDDEYEKGPLDRIPEWIVSLGAGFLLTSTLLTATGAASVGYLVMTGRYAGVFDPLRPYASQLVLVEVQLLLATVFQLGGLYFAKVRIRWGTVMAACFFGSLVIITLPFTIPALVLLGLGKQHFTLNTPAHLVQDDTKSD